jgi:prepilin signal peptidase PulO-like enzyme (type II secretory pathway)
MYALLALAVISLFVQFDPLSLRVPEILDVLMGPILFLFFALLYVFSKGRAVGFGDAKLSLALGLLLGYPEGISAFMLAFWIGALVGIGLLASRYIPRMRFGMPPMGKGQSVNASNGVYFSYDRSSHWSGKSEVPFAPFLALGFFLVYFFNISVFPLF